MTVPARTTIAIAICTFRRNELLTRLLDALIICAERTGDRAALGVALVDDTTEGLARPVAEALADRFELGLSTGFPARRISRWLAILRSKRRLKWPTGLVMTDDDCEPPRSG